MFDPKADLEEKNSKIDKFFDVQKSHLDLDSDMLKGDLGLNGFAVKTVSYNTLLLEMVDQDAGIKEEGGLFFSANTDIKGYRRGIVRMVGPTVQRYKVGDMVLFPGVKGLPAGKLYIKNGDEYEFVKNAHFIAEDRLFGTLEPVPAELLH